MVDPRAPLLSADWAQACGEKHASAPGLGRCPVLRARGRQPCLPEAMRMNKETVWTAPLKTGCFLLEEPSRQCASVCLNTRGVERKSFRSMVPQGGCRLCLFAPLTSSARGSMAPPCCPVGHSHVKPATGSVPEEVGKQLHRTVSRTVEQNSGTDCAKGAVLVPSTPAFVCNRIGRRSLSSDKASGSKVIGAKSGPHLKMKEFPVSPVGPRISSCDVPFSV